MSLTVTKGKTTISWTKPKYAKGYEIYRYVPKNPEEPDAFFLAFGPWEWYERSYKSTTIWSVPSDGFKKLGTVKGANKTTMTYKINNQKVYVYRVRAYTTVNGKKLYSDYSNFVTTDSASAILNGVKLKPTATVSGETLKLVKAAVAECVDKKMSQIEKAAAIYAYVCNAATYEYDYTKGNL